MDSIYPTQASGCTPPRRASEGSRPMGDAFFRTYSPPPGVSRLALSETHAVRYPAIIHPVKSNRSFSPRENALTIRKMAHSIGAYLQKGGKQYPQLVFPILAQIYYNQYEPLSPDGTVLIAGLAKIHLLEPCLFAIQFLTSPKSPFPPSLSPNLLKFGLQILKQSAFQDILDQNPLKQAIDHIFKVGKELQDEELRELLQKAKCAMAVSNSLAFAKEGLQLLSRCIHDKEDRIEFKGYQPSESDPFCDQKFFLRAVDAYLIKNPFQLRLNQLQKDSLLQCSLALLTAPDAPNLLLTDPGIQLISKRILEKSFAECSAPDTPRRIHLIESILSSPYVSLFQLQLLMLWMQDALDRQNEFSILAGSREKDPEGNLCRFAMMRFEKLAAQRPSELDILRQLLRFIYCWRASPANQELLSDPNIEANWQVCSLLIHQNNDLQILQEQLEREFFISSNHWISGRSFLNPQQNAAVSGSFWDSEEAVDILRDSLLSYFLVGQEVKILDLVRHPEEASPAILLQSKRFNQVVQYFVSQLLQESNSFDAIQRMVKVMCLAKEALIEKGAFQPALTIHAAFHQASINRLWEGFQLPSFSSHIVDEGIWSNVRNFQKLRAVQDEHPNPFEVFFLVLHTLAFAREIPELTEDGEINLHRLQILGDLFNTFIIRKEKAKYSWADVDLRPDPALLNEFSRQSGQLDEKGLLEHWWNRSQEIHRSGSPHYWEKRPRNTLYQK